MQKSSKQALYRILDANLDRAREGLRVVEEWCRFGLENAELSNQCKQMRQELAVWHADDLRAARNTPADPGIALSHQNESIRTDIKSVLQANFCRIQEALRVLEEYGKVYNSEMGNVIKQMRYQVYALESSLVSQNRLDRLKHASLYLVTMPVENLFAKVEAALQGGVSLVQYREKDRDDSHRVSIASQLCQLCHKYEALFLVNDRVDIALAVGADGVHLGQQDLPVAVARSLLGKHHIIGQSSTNPDELQKALEAGADYVGVGPVYATPTKPGKAAAGLEYVRYAAAKSSVPWYAIGSVDADNLQEVIGAGASRVAVVRSLMMAENPTVVAQSMRSLLETATHKKLF